jgi:hypothetical protein
MAGNSNANVPQLNHDVTGLTRTIQELALLVGMRFVVDDQKIKALSAGCNQAQLDQSRSITRSATTT